jgi:hypothetical protein
VGKVHHLSAPDLTVSVGWQDISHKAPPTDRQIEMADDRGVIVRGTFVPGASYSYQGGHYVPRKWREID